MKYLNLVIDNKNGKSEIFFNKKELQLILNLYAQMVSGGEWKDYGLNISKKEVSFNVYHRASEFPVYKITKNLKPKKGNEKYLVKDNANKINLKNEGWKKLNYYWIYFFLFVATLNEMVWRTQSELFWVNFKVWGLLPVTILFTASTIPIIKKYKLEK